MGLHCSRLAQPTVVTCLSRRSRTALFFSEIAFCTDLTEASASSAIFFASSSELVVS